MTDGFGALFAQIILIGQIGFERQAVVAPGGVTEHLQVVHPLIGQVDITTRVVVVDIAESHFQSVGIGKEAAFRVRVGYAHIGMEMIAGIA